MSSDSLPRVVVGLAMGLCSGLLLSFAAVWLAAGRPIDPLASRAVAWTALLGGWAISSAWMLRRARSVGTVVQRGLLLSTAEWALVAVLGMAFSVDVAGDAIATGNEASMEAGIVTGGVALVVVLVCAGGMAMLSLAALMVARFVGRKRVAAPLA